MLSKGTPGYSLSYRKPSTEMTFLLTHGDAASIPLKSFAVSHGKTSCGMNGSDTEDPAGILGGPQIPKELCVQYEVINITATGHGLLKRLWWLLSKTVVILMVYKRHKTGCQPGFEA